MPEIDLTAGPIAYDDSGDDGPALVFLHGLAMDGAVWRHVVADLRADHRCVVPTIPLGGHHRPMRPDADLTLHGISRLVAEFLASPSTTSCSSSTTGAAPSSSATPDHGRRLAQLLPDATLVEVADS